MTSPSAKKEMAERRALAGSTTTTTFHQQAMIDLQLESGGRFAKDTIVSGTEASVRYPAGPAWTRDQVGIEPPLGVAIDDLEPTGNAHEIEHSLAQVAAPVVPITHDRQSAEVPSFPSDGERRVVAGLSNESGDPAATSAEERLAQILPKLAVAVPKPNRRKV
jgi:hypothetical protein